MMNPSSSGQPSTPNGGPEYLSKTEPGRAAAPLVLEFVLEVPQLRKKTTAWVEPSLELPTHFVSLVDDLSQESGQLKRRRAQGLDDPRKICRQLTKLEKLDLIHRPYQRPTLVPWQELVVIAATVVDGYLGNKELAASTLAQLHGRELRHDTIIRDKRIVREIIQLTDHLYLQWKHNLAFELPILLDTPISVLRSQSARKFNEFKLLLQKQTPSAGITSPLKLYIPFLVRLLRPKYNLTVIQKALQTSLFGPADGAAFWEALHGPTPEYDAIRDTWTKHEPLPSSGLELSEFIDYKRIYPATICISISGFIAFETSPDLQRKAAYANRNQTGYTSADGRIIAFNWDEDIQGPVMHQVLEDLAKSGFLQAEEIYLDKVSVSHGSINTDVPPGRLQIIVPIEASEGPVSVGSKGSSTTVEWDTGTGYMLDQYTRLSTLARIKYVSLLLVL
ncbi:hypothetical protein F66182_3143 [Fusarium sp. NRRL 66182]|nr:hypothetical protein F66182_3143 [Fusarium sp. NRRL 66182]